MVRVCLQYAPSSISNPAVLIEIWSRLQYEWKAQHEIFQPLTTRVATITPTSWT